MSLVDDKHAMLPRPLVLPPHTQPGDSTQHPLIQDVNERTSGQPGALLVAGARGMAEGALAERAPP